VTRTRIIFAREDLKEVRFTRPQIKYLCEEAIRYVLFILSNRYAYETLL
jgi:hypothetical protein